MISVLLPMLYIADAMSSGRRFMSGVNPTNSSAKQSTPSPTSTHLVQSGTGTIAQICHPTYTSSPTSISINVIILSNKGLMGLMGLMGFAYLFIVSLSERYGGDGGLLR